MTTRADGGPAFPATLIETRFSEGLGREVEEERVHPGMSLRDYFAGQALSCLNYHNILATAMTPQDCEYNIRNVAALSYRLADALLAERDR